jgi:hypothetical protein
MEFTAELATAGFHKIVWRNPHGYFGRAPEAGDEDSGWAVITGDPDVTGAGANWPYDGYCGNAESDAYRETRPCEYRTCHQHHC